MKARVHYEWIGLITFLALGGCGASTQYAGIAPEQLSDNQLIEELQSAVQGYGIAMDRTAYLIAIRPGPAYVLTSSSSAFAGSINASYNAYTMPSGYGESITEDVSGTVQGQSNTQYHYTDANAAARLGNAIATAIQESRQAAYRRRAEEVWAEYQRRVAARRAATQQIIDQFFNAHPDLAERRMLVAAVAPWAAAQGPIDGRETLERARQLIDSNPRGAGLSGVWYGIFSQITTLNNGATLGMNQFLRIQLTDSNGTVSGIGVLGTGEKIELSGSEHNQHLDATVANVTSAINVTANAITAPTQITGEFSGFGQGARLHGQFTLLR